MQPLHWRHPLRCRHHSEDHRRARQFSLLRARKPRHRPRSGWVYGAQEAGGVLLMTSLNPNRAEGGIALVESPENPQPDQIFAIEEFLALERNKDLLRFSTAGSVDD